MARMERPAWPRVARVSSTGPHGAQATVPRVAQARKPHVAQGVKPRVAQATVPRVARVTEPRVARARRSSEVQPAHSREKDLQVRACAAIQ